MKKLNFIIKYGLALLLLSFYSCESWLNVTPSDRLSEEMLFNDRAFPVAAPCRKTGRISAT